jgi:uncharacterized RDD family membrane protein YckC
METKRWYYAIDDDNKIAISEDDLRTLFKTGKLGMNTLVWTETKTSWKPANEYEEFKSIKNRGLETDEDNHIKAAFTQIDNEIKYIRPWKRFIARMIDYVIYIFSLMLIHDFVNIYIMHIKLKLPALIFYASLWLWIFIEAILLSVFGTTPGKWLLNIFIKDVNNDRMRFDNALIRSLNVFIKGFGMGIPIINFFAIIISYNHLLRDGKSSWDIEDGNILIFKEVGLVRSAFIAIMVLVLISLLDSYYF